MTDHPSSQAQAFYEQGLQALRQGRLDLAAEALTHATTCREDFGAAWNMLGVALARQGKLEGAITAWDQMIALEPEMT